MAVDTPATIAVLGAGPVGLEAALYARFLGYDVQIYEQADVAHHVLAWGHATMFSPFARCRSTLGLAALAAHDPAWQRPADDARLTGRQWAQQYLIPLSETDLLVDSIRTHTRVVAIGRDDPAAGDDAASPDRDDGSFRITVRGPDGHQRSVSADVVIDATGSYGNPNPLGAAGAPADGELALRDRIQYTLPDVLSRDRALYAGRHTLVVGAGCSAATTILALCQVAAELPGTRVTWASPHPAPTGAAALSDHAGNEALLHRDRVLQQAHGCTAGSPPPVAFLPETMVQAIQWDKDHDRFTVHFTGNQATVQQFDRVVSHTGFHPDLSICDELQISEAQLAARPDDAVDGLPDRASGADPDGAAGIHSLQLPQRNFYVVGSKRHGGRPDFLMTTGLDQIRRLFTLIGDRANLDLYANMQRLIGEPS